MIPELLDSLRPLPQRTSGYASKTSRYGVKCRPHGLLLFVIRNTCLTLRFLLGTVAFMTYCLKHMEIKQNVVYIM